MTNKPTCVESITDPGTRGMLSHLCGKPAPTMYKGLPYCKLHNPALRKERRDKRDAAICRHKEPYQSKCGKPAVEVDSIGYGRCAEHTNEHLAYLARLQKAAPALLEALHQIVGSGGGNPLYTSWGEAVDVDQIAKAAIAQVEGKKA